MCGGRTHRSAYADICQQENGPCGWLIVRENKVAQDTDRGNVYWEKTRMPRGREHHQTHYRDDFLMLHVAPTTLAGVDTIITKGRARISKKHNIEWR
jgi:hypothetical protein